MAAKPNNRKALWLGLVLILVLLTISAIGLYQFAFQPDSDDVTGGPIEMPSTQGDFSLPVR